ncbi:MAG: hypothetical protein U0736_13240 [Gemmataceae bacterium]
MLIGQLPGACAARHLVLHVEVPEIADGLMQWPGTEPLIAVRLGPDQPEAWPRRTCRYCGSG